MKLLQYRQGQATKLGVLTEKGVFPVEEAGRVSNVKVPNSMRELIELGDQGLELLQDLIHQARAYEGEFVYLQEEELSFLPIVTDPEKIVCIGLNYRPHAEEAKMEVPDTPVLFSKFNNALAGHNEEIHLSPNASKYDYEAELVIVMGKQANNVSEEDALSYVYGYSVGNDLSARDLQMLTGQWLIGKMLDQFAPNGPYLVTADEVENPDQLTIQAKVNGEVRQHSNTDNMIFNCAYLVSYISRYMTLKPGDLIYTGTPEGVILGHPRGERVWLRSGDEVEIIIEQLGTLRNVLTE